MNRVRLVAASVAGLAAMLAVVGSFLPLFSARLPFFGAASDGTAQEVDIVISAWDLDSTAGFTVGTVPVNGVPLVIGAAVLAFAALLCRRAAVPGATQGGHRLAGMTTLAGAAFLACAALMVTLQVINWDDAYAPAEEIALPTAPETAYRAGLWTLLTAAAMAVVATVYALRPVSQPPAPTVDPDAPTPPFGLSLPVTTQPPVEEEPPLLTVDPLTGAPHPPPDEPLPPIIIPAAPPPEPRRPGSAVPLTDDPLADPGHD